MNSVNVRISLTEDLKGLMRVHVALQATFNMSVQNFQEHVLCVCKQ